MTNEEEVIELVATDIDRTLRAHTDGLPERIGEMVAYTGVCLALGRETLRALRAGGLDPDLSTLADALASVPSDQVAEMALREHAGRT